MEVQVNKIQVATSLMCKITVMYKGEPALEEGKRYKINYEDDTRYMIRDSTGDEVEIPKNVQDPNNPELTFGDLWDIVVEDMTEEQFLQLQIERTE